MAAHSVKQARCKIDRSVTALQTISPLMVAIAAGV
jgi:hypothetical protein